MFSQIMAGTDDIEKSIESKKKIFVLLAEESVKNELHLVKVHRSLLKSFLTVSFVNCINQIFTGKKSRCFDLFFHLFFI